MDGKAIRFRLAAWRHGDYFPLVVVFLPYCASIFIAAGILLIPGEPQSSPLWHDTSVSDAFGGCFPLPTISAWATALLVGVIFSAPSQLAMFVSWAVFTSRRRSFRLAVSLLAAAILYTMMEVMWDALSSTHVGDWNDAVAPFMLMPLALLCLAGPLAVSAIASGRRLLHRDASLSCSASPKQFSIASLLCATTGIAASLTLARLRKSSGDEAEIALVMLIYSTIFILPMVWCALAIRRRSISLISSIALAALFSAPFVLPTSVAIGPINVGVAAGTFWTVPCSLLIWRLCGYRLVPAKANVPKNSD